MPLFYPLQVVRADAHLGNRVDIAKGTNNKHIRAWFDKHFTAAWKQYKDTHLTPTQRERARVILMLDSATTHKKAFAGCGDGGLVKDDIYVCWVGEGATYLIQPVDQSKIHKEVQQS